jgi:hypothetical protein
MPITTTTESNVTAAGHSPAPLPLSERVWLPDCVNQTVRRFERELDLRQGMIADLHQLALQNHGMDPEDCDSLVRHVRDRDDLKTALECIERIFT